VAEPAVVNALPLIYLARCGCIELLQVASTPVFVPAAVDGELRRRGPDDPAVQAMDQAPWIITVSDEPIPALIQAWDLGAGESAVLAWAEAHHRDSRFAASASFAPIVRPKPQFR
jgi:predicted nucleic acid-binding protein